MIRPPSHSFTGDLLFDYIYAQRKEGHFLWARVAGLATSLFAALDVFHHLGQALYKTGHILLTKTSRFTFADVRTHLKQAAWFTASTAVGSLVAVILPQVGPNHLCRKAILDQVEKKPETLGHIQFALKQDKTLIFAAVGRNGMALNDTLCQFRTDREVVLEAVDQNGLALGSVPVSFLHTHPNVAFCAVHKDPLALEWVDAAFIKKHPSIAPDAVNQNGLALQYIPAQYIKENPKEGHRLVRLAVDNNGLALRWTKGNEELLKQHPEIVDAAVIQNGLALQFAPEAKKKNQGTAILAVHQNGLALQYVDTTLQNDRPVVLAALTQNGTALQFASLELREDPAFIGEALDVAKDWWHLLPYFTEKLTQNPELMEKLGKVMREYPPTPPQVAPTRSTQYVEDGFGPASQPNWMLALEKWRERVRAWEEIL